MNNKYPLTIAGSGYCRNLEVTKNPITMTNLSSTNEIWKSISGYEGIYEISNLGRVRSLPRFIGGKLGPLTRPINGRILKQYIMSNGYYACNLSQDCTDRVCTVHRLIAMAFIPNPHNHPVINHINGIRTDNRIENLEWCTYAYNSQHSCAMRREKSKVMIGISGALNKRSKPINQLSKDGIFIQRWESVNLARKAGFQAVWSVVNGRRKYSNGFLWEYADSKQS